MWEPGTELGVLDLSYLGLVPAWRGHGLGSELVGESFRFAREFAVSA